MEEDLPKEAADVTLQKLAKEDLYDLSVEDLEERIVSLKAEIERCESALEKRDSTKAAADKLFKF